MVLIRGCGSHNDTVTKTNPQVTVGGELTCQHQNQTLLAEGPEIMICPVGSRQWRMHDRFSAGDFQTMIALYLSGATRAEVAERFGISESSVRKMLLYVTTAYANGQRPHSRDSARGLKMISTGSRSNPSPGSHAAPITA